MFLLPHAPVHEPRRPPIPEGHLETAGAVNDARYRRHGFAVSGRSAVPGGPTVTRMIRPATREEQR